ncbi:hypothetical protein VFPPC_16620 [Pochonia chlamydosporia 170]|uniref:Uncharacterized protein n=1 Tax=Pochonia chlamydosporia 170 TaxID=1380566 RepID=A0A179F9R6_METCM|nr:hypothetical protein VFPPC_16620 [Pochonia chlamydosporia 170]OAQ62188.2 hypothetical protein VFPPC_16620 [Pochonia chlamydosporia 170]
MTFCLIPLSQIHRNGRWTCLVLTTSALRTWRVLEGALQKSPEINYHSDMDMEPAGAVLGIG